MQELSLGRSHGDVHQTVRAIVLHDFLEHFVLGHQERLVVNVGPGPDLLGLWGCHGDDGFIERGFSASEGGFGGDEDLWGILLGVL